MDLGQWRRALIEGWREEVSSDEEQMEASPQPNHRLSGAFGPLYGEEEDLATAIALSLAEQDFVQTPRDRKGGVF